MGEDFVISEEVDDDGLVDQDQSSIKFDDTFDQPCDCEGCDCCCSEPQEFSVDISTADAHVVIARRPLDGIDPTWSELLDTFYAGLMGLGYSFTKDTNAKFKELINGDIILDEDDN
jgi:hypothetical protein